MARVNIGGAFFVILATCCKDLIVGMDFLREYGVVINIPDRLATFYQNPAPVHSLEPPRNSLRLSDDDVIPPQSCTLVFVACDAPFDIEGVAEQITPLLLTHGISVASTSFVGTRICC